MLKIETSIVIKRPVEEVFAVVSNHENYPRWNPSVLEVKKTSSGSIGRGTTWRSVSRRLGRRTVTESEIVEYEPNRKITRQHKHGMPVRDKLTFEIVAGSTHLAETIEAEPNGFFKLAVTALMPLLKRQLTTGLANLKKQMEANAL